MQIPTIMAHYQLVKATVPNTPANPNNLEVVGQFAAPPGFRVAQMMRLKDTTLVGQPHQVLLLMEQVFQTTVDVPDHQMADGEAAEGGEVVELRPVPEGVAEQVQDMLQPKGTA